MQSRHNIPTQPDELVSQQTAEDSGLGEREGKQMKGEKRERETESGEREAEEERETATLYVRVCVTHVLMS